MAAVALSLGHWPFAVPLLEMEYGEHDWILAVDVIERADALRWPTEEG